MIPDSMQLKARPCVNVAVAIVTLLAKFYIVVSQQVVVTVAVVLEMHACVGRDHAAFYVACFPTEASARICFDLTITYLRECVLL